MTQEVPANRLLAGRYRILRHLARGGMSNVYLAEDERLDRQVAIKVIAQHLAQDSGFRAKFIREAKVAAKLNHPNLVNVYDQGEDGDVVFLAMEYVPGMTLRDALKRFGKLSPLRTLELFNQIIEGLAAAHRAGILHRDVKPENVFLSDDGRIKLGDFGLARNADAATATDSLMGTIAYLAPELITRGHVDARADVYASGILLYELLTGEQPFQSEQAAHIAHLHTTASMPIPSEKSPEVPALLDELVLWATAKRPGDRPANAVALGQVLAQATAEIKAGRGNTTRLDLPEFSEHEATKVLPVGATARIAVDELAEQYETEQLQSDLFGPDAASDSSNATAVLNREAEQTLSPLEWLSQRRKRNERAIAISIFAVVLFATGLGWWFGSGPGGLAVVPNLQNRTLAQAEATLSSYSSQIESATEPSATIEEGFVVRTEPAAGTFLIKGSKITVFLSAGPKMVNLPELAGLTIDSAKSALVREGFKAGDVTEWFTAKAKGLIFDYTGSAEKSLAEGSTVDLRASLGPLPLVQGLDQASAIRLLQDAGLRISQVDATVFSDSVAIGKVIGVRGANESIAAGADVVLQVSRGPSTVEIPNLIGETLSAAKLALSNVGLNVQVSTDQLEKNWGIVRVKSISPKVGTVVEVGTTVTISNR